MITFTMIVLMARLFAFSFGGDVAVYQAQFERSPELAQAMSEAQSMVGYDSWRLMSEPRKFAMLVALYDLPETRYNVALGNALRDRDFRRAGAIYRTLNMSIPEARQLNLAWSLETGEWL